MSTRGNAKSAGSRTSQPQLAPPPDGGWGWVVVLSSFMISVFVDGVCFSFGVFFNPFREAFHGTKAETAWVGSVLTGTYLSVGPIVSAFVNRYGCRSVSMVGGVFAAISFFISTFSPTIPILILTYGFLAGVGFGLMYLPAMVMVGYYFEKRRALATGIACCGSGIGAFLFAPLCNYLLEEYAWKGAIWIVSGIVLNGLVFSIFFRPLEHRTLSQDEEMQVMENGQSPEIQKRALLGRNESDADEVEMTQIVKVTGLSSSVGDVQTIVINCPSTALGSDGDKDGALPRADGVTVPAMSSPVVSGDVLMNPGDVLLQDERDSGQKNENVKEKGVEDEGHEGGDDVEKDSKSDEVVNELFHTVTPEIHNVQSVESKTFMSDFQLQKSSNAVARMAFSQDGLGPSRIKKRQPKHRQHQTEAHHHSHNYLEVDNPLQRRDIFYSGSLRHIPEYRSSESMAEYRQKVVKVEEVEREEGSRSEEDEGDSVLSQRRKSCLRRVVCDPLLKVFDISLLKSLTFDIYCFSCFLCMLGFFVPFIYLPTLCIDLDMGASKAAFLISIIGIANTVGRVGVGFVSDQPWADCLLINNVALVIGGVATCCVPFFHVYALFGAYAFVFGTSIAIFVSLRTIIMVELMGLQKLTNAFGLVIMSQGISSYIGAPIAGLLSDFTGDYNISFYVAGIFLALGGVICFPLRRIAHWEEERLQKKHDQAQANSLLHNKSK